MEQYFRVGVITQPHGLRGEVKVFPTTSDKDRFESLSEVRLVRLEDGRTLGRSSTQEEFHLETSLVAKIKSVKYFKQFIIVKFQGIDHINEVEQWKGMSIFVDRAHAIPLADDEYYVADLIGLKVVTDCGKTGILRDVVETGANDVYLVDFEDHKNVMIPAIKDCILDINIKEKQMKIHLMEGLLT